MTNKALKKKEMSLKTKFGSLNIISARAGVHRRNGFEHQNHTEYV